MRAVCVGSKALFEGQGLVLKNHWKLEKPASSLLPLLWLFLGQQLAQAGLH